MSLCLALWVTSRCNLSCPQCNQQATIQAFKDYTMDKPELEHIISSCLARNIHFKSVELTGGEPSLWPLLDWGIGELNKSGIADSVTFITNGNDAERVAKLANKHSINYTVSSSQASSVQVRIHKEHKEDVLWNEHAHKVLPKFVVSESLPAVCSQQLNRFYQPMTQLSYIKGSVYYCCMAFANSAIVGYDPRYACSFDSDFIAYFADRKFDVPICSVCLCNRKIWEKV